MRKAVLSVLVSAVVLSSGFAQNVNISGKVSNASGAAISGAVVRIFNTPLACTSKTDGTYLLFGSTGIAGSGATVSRMNSIMYRNGSFVFNVSSPVQASANLYDLAGRMVAKIFNGRLIQGSTKVPFSFNRPGRTMLVLRAKIGDASVISIVNPAAGADFAINQQSKANGTLAKTAALDWLQASKAGYASYMQTIDAYSGVINITLAALAGAPNFG